MEEEEEPSGFLSAEKLAAAIVEVSRDAFVVVDERGVIRFASDGIRRFDVPGDLVGRSAFDLLDPTWVEEATIDLEAAFAGKVPGGRVAATELRLADGTSVVAELSIHRPKDSRVGALLVQVHAVPGARPLDDFLQAMVEARDLDDLLQPVLRLAIAEVPAEGCSIHWGRTEGAFSKHISAGVDPDLLGGDRFDRQDVPWHRAADHDETVVLSSLEGLDTDFARAADGQGFGSVWCLPVPSPGDGKIVLSVWRAREGPLTSTNSLSAERVLKMTTLAFERHRTEEKLRHAALHDPLTGAPNRTLLDSHLDTVLGESDGTDAVLALDLDGFKEINDRFGHPVGDVVLKVVVERLERALRPGDLLARLGGDEFAVVCRGVSDAAEAGTIAHRLLDLVSRPIAAEGRSVRVGVSIGISLTEPGRTGDQLLRAADEALIRAKRDGKGTFHFASPAERG